MTTHNSSATRTPSAWAPLRQPIFRALMIASVTSNIGTWMQNVGATWLMTSLAPAPIMLALVQAATFLPIFLISVPAGAVADLFDRRKVLICSQLWMLIAAGLLALLTWKGHITPWSLLGLTFLLDLGAAMNNPAWQAGIPEMVPSEDLPRAVALGSASFNLARAVGPAIGGYCVAAFGPAANFALNAVSFLGVLIVLYRWDRKIPERTGPREKLLSAAISGLRYVRHSQALHRILAQVFCFGLSASALWALLPVVAHQTFSGTAMTYGLLLGCMGAGAVTGAFSLPMLRARFSLRGIMTTLTLLFAATQMIVATSHWITLDCVFLVGAGFAWLSVLSQMNVMVQTSVPGWVRARALSIYLLVFFGAMSGGSAAWGALATWKGTSLALACASVGLFFTALLMLFCPLLPDRK